MSKTDPYLNHIEGLTDRPASQRKLAEIMAAARKEFFESGFSATSIEAIAARADVSKVTIYSWFGDKSNLFAQVVQTECVGMRKKLALDDMEIKSLSEILTRIGTGILHFLTRPETINFERMLSAEVKRDPQVGPLFLDNGPRIMLNDLSKLMKRFGKKGEIFSDDFHASAELFVSLVIGRLDLFLRYGHTPDLSEEARAKRVQRAVRLWMLAHTSHD